MCRLYTKEKTNACQIEQHVILYQSNKVLTKRRRVVRDDIEPDPQLRTIRIPICIQSGVCAVVVGMEERFTPEVIPLIPDVVVRVCLASYGCRTASAEDTGGEGEAFAFVAGEAHGGDASTVGGWVMCT